MKIRVFFNSPFIGIRRFPLGFTASVIATTASVLLQHQKGMGLDSATEGSLTKLLLLWPFALFGNVALGLRIEYERRQQWIGLTALLLMLIGGWFILPDQPNNALDGFWFAYWFSIAGLVCATLSITARLKESPSLWDTGWSITLATFMSGLSAMIIVGGINTALFSVEKLFGLKLFSKIYTDVALTSFFLLAPLTAFAWLPRPFGINQPQPAWLKGAVRVILMPLCALYALILIAYIVKIALAAKWPDGWVAMPTLVFAALGLAGYLIARPARDIANERWAKLFCRVFPVILGPLSIVLLLAMRVRVLEYGFTEWRTAGLFLGGWLLAFAVGYTGFPKISPWWITATLTILLAIATAGPFSLNTISIQSQSARLDRMLDLAGVWRKTDNTVISVSAKNGNDIKSALKYLLRNHGAEALPEQVRSRWAEWRKTKGQTPLPEFAKQNRRLYNEENNVLEALGVAVLNDNARWVTIRCDFSTLPLTNWSRLSIGKIRQPENDMITINNNLQVSFGNRPVASNEVNAFCRQMNQIITHTNSANVILPPDKMTVRFTHAGRRYQILFMQLTLSGTHSNAPSAYHSYGENYLVFEE